MAFQHLHFNDQTQYGRGLRRMLQQAEESDESQVDQISLMSLMIDGDGSQDAHYAEITVRYGFVDDASSHAAYNELQSAYSKISGNGSVTDVRAARDQLFNKLRG